jgi:hypothetical protein
MLATVPDLKSKTEKPLLENFSVHRGMFGFDMPIAKRTHMFTYAVRRYARRPKDGQITIAEAVALEKIHRPLLACHNFHRALGKRSVAHC